ncbi:hypothetical protein SAMN05216466_12244 [Paraburkholderia phenazinium]|uniref:Uncharacterized protein n=2 Tax=Paraburkholderia phenazinium TaxID=60549 RepID=A0A1G8KA68_9BURK|nr:hypothetical protein SAMN05216466_12244 [Paraburkholderia phenazinium]
MPSSRISRSQTPAPLPFAAGASSSSSAQGSTSAGAGASRKGHKKSGVLSFLGMGRSSRRKKQTDNAEPPPPVSAAPGPRLRRVPHIDERKPGFTELGIEPTGQEGSSQPELRRASSAPQLPERRSGSLGAHIGRPEQSSNVVALPRFDSSPDQSPVHETGHVEHEIFEEPPSDSDHDTHSDTASIHSGGTPPQSESSPVRHETEPLPTSRNDPANLVRDAHEERNKNRYHANTDITYIGIRTTSRPGKPMTLRQGGPSPTPVDPATPAEPGTVQPPPSARAETGLRQGKKLKALKAFVQEFATLGLRRSKSDSPAQRQSSVETIAPTLLNEGNFNARVQSLFTSTGETADHVELAQRLRTQRPTPEPDAPPDPNRTEFSFTHPMLIAERLAQVSGGDAGRALAAFDALRQGRFLTFGTVAPADGSNPAPLESLLTLEPGRPSLATPQLDALRTAARLASSPAGFEALLRTLQPGLPENRQAHLKRFLEAAAKVEAERGAPADIAVHASAARGARDTNQTTLAQDVLLIESRALEHVGDDPHASLDASEKAAIFSWNNGFRDRGPGTELAKVQGRLAKMNKYIQRANHLQDLRNVRFDRSNMVRSTAKVIDAKARIVAMRAQQTIGRKKTPLTGLRKFGANNNLLKHPDEDVQALDDNAKAVVKALRAHNQQRFPDLETFARELPDPRTRKLPEPVLRDALLEHWESLFEEQQMRPLGNKLDNAALKSIAGRIATRYDVDTPQTRELIEGHLQRWAGSTLKRKGWGFERTVSRELTLADLQKWARDTHMPMTERTALGREIARGSPPQEARERVADGAAPASPVHHEETEFAAALRKALTVVDSAAVRPDDLTPDGLHRFTRTYLLDHSWGNPLTASNGGTVGINTASISESIRYVTEKFAPVSVVPILDLKISRSANAVMSIGSTTHGGEIFIGTQRQKAGSMGVGLTASGGPGVLAKVLGQGTASAEITPLAIESVKTRGVMVRALRRPKSDGSGFDTDSARTELVAFNDLVWSVAKGEHGALSPDKTWELIANRFFESQTLSIGWQDQDAQTVHHPVSASAGVRVGHLLGKIAGAFSKSEAERAALSVGYANDLTTHGSNRRKEETGRNRMVRANYLWRFQQNMTLSATQTNPTIPLSHAAGPVTASLASGPTQGTRTFALDDRGFNATFRTIVKSGKLSEPFTLREFEERNAKDFVKFLNEPARHAQFTQVFKAANGPDNGEQAFEDFKTKVKNWAGPGQHYVTRYRIRAEDRKKLDELAAFAHAIHERDPQDPMLSRIEKDMKTLLEDEDSWIPSQTFSLEGQTARDTQGINLGVQFSAQETVASDRELSAVVVPLPIANEWTRERRDNLPNGTSIHLGSGEPTAGA